MSILGLSLYTWSFAIFACVIFVISLLLLYRPAMEETAGVKTNVLVKAAMELIFLVTCADSNQCRRGCQDDCFDSRKALVYSQTFFNSSLKRSGFHVFSSQ
jgi:hypothetical protein